MPYLYRVESIGDCRNLQQLAPSTDPWFRFLSAPQTKPDDEDLRDELRQHILECYESDDPGPLENRYYTCTSESLMWAFWLGFQYQIKVRLHTTKWA